MVVNVKNFFAVNVGRLRKPDTQPEAKNCKSAGIHRLNRSFEAKTCENTFFFFRTTEIGRFWRNFLYFCRNFLISTV